MDELKKIAVLFDPTEAEIVRGLLEAQGIPVMLSKEGASTAFGVNVGAFGEIEVLVPTSRADEAEKIYHDNFESGETEED